MKTRASTGLLFASMLAMSAGVDAAENHGSHWGYTGKTGASYWGDLSQEFAGCKLGKEQSPIDIPSKAAERGASGPIRTRYKASAGELVNNGNTIQVNLADGGAIETSAGTFKLLQFHFHTPSEDKIDGKSFPMVAHLVHTNDAGNLAVVAVLLKQGKENPVLKDIFNMLPAREGKSDLNARFDATTLLPGAQGYYTFKGSLTTPPCSEGVTWYVFKTPVDVSAAQIAAFQKIFSLNARPVQPLNGRKVVEVP
jgi:carbonic anhydrase